MKVVFLGLAVEQHALAFLADEHDRVNGGDVEHRVSRAGFEPPCARQAAVCRAFPGPPRKASAPHRGRLLSPLARAWRPARVPSLTGPVRRASGAGRARASSKTAAAIEASLNRCDMAFPFYYCASGTSPAISYFTPARGSCFSIWTYCAALRPGRNRAHFLDQRALGLEVRFLDRHVAVDQRRGFRVGHRAGPVVLRVADQQHRDIVVELVQFLLVGLVDRPELLASASVRFMFAATTSFLSAFSFSRRTCMLSAGAAAAGLVCE